MEADNQALKQKYNEDVFQEKKLARELEELKKILELLLQGDSYLTLDFLSHHVGISKRSIQNYMHKLEDWLSDMGFSDIELHKKQGHGIKLLISDGSRKKLEDILNAEKFSLFDEGVLRRLEMLKALIFSNDELTIDQPVVSILLESLWRDLQ